MINALLFLLHQQDPGKGCLAKGALYPPSACGRHSVFSVHQNFTISDVTEGVTGHVFICGEKPENVARA